MKEIIEKLENVASVIDAKSFTDLLNYYSSGWAFSKCLTKIENSAYNSSFHILSKEEAIDEVINYLSILDDDLLETELERFSVMYKYKFNYFDFKLYGLLYYMEKLSLDELYAFICGNIVSYKNFSMLMKHGVIVFR